MAREHRSNLGLSDDELVEIVEQKLLGKRHIQRGTTVLLPSGETARVLWLYKFQGVRMARVIRVENRMSETCAARNFDNTPGQQVYKLDELRRKYR